MTKIRTSAPQGCAPRATGAGVPHPIVRMLGGLLVPAVLLSCGTAPEARVPARTLTGAGLLRPADGSDADPLVAMRNDDRLGARRDAFVRLPVEVESATLDRQWILNGRPFDRFRTTTVTRERLVR